MTKAITTLGFEPIKTFGLDGLAIGIIAFFGSIILSNLYVSGDQIQYVLLYKELSNYGLFDGYSLYVHRLGASEPVYYFLVWIGSHLAIPKVILMSLANFLVALVFYKLFQIWSSPRLLALALVLGNLYFSVIFFSAERLKFGILFLGLALTNREQPLRSIFYFGLAALSHFEILVVVCCLFFSWAINQLSRLLLRGTFSFWIVVILVGVVIIFGLFGERLVQKFLAYYAGIHYGDLLKIGIFLIGSVVCTKDKKYATLVYVPLLILISLLGGTRLNMLGFGFFIYFGLQRRKGTNLIFLLCVAYYLVSDVTFLANIVNFGDGYGAFHTN